MFMAYCIYEDRENGRAVIHKDNCQRYVDLKSAAAPDTECHEGYESVDAATRRAQRTGCRYVGECAYCPQ